MKYDIIIAGVGGQGILTIASLLGEVALREGLHIKQAEVHGMAQRGGAVQSHFRLADGAIQSDVIPLGGADLILSMEPMEALRYLGWRGEQSWIVANREPVKNIPDYPPEQTLFDALQSLPHVWIDGPQLARDAGSTRSLNMVMLGAASPFVPLPVEAVEQCIVDRFAAKGEKVAETNRKAFQAGRNAAMQSRQEA